MDRRASPSTARAIARLITCAALALAASGGEGVARAQAVPSEESRSLATALFKEGRKLLEAGQVAEACRKLAESQRLDPGGGTLLNLAVCHEREGKSASAWAEFTRALGQARKEGREDRVAVAEARIAVLEPRLSRVTVVVAEASKSTALEVTLDGTPLGRAAWGMPLPLDPGAHALEARAPGMRPWHEELTIGPEGDAQTVSVPTLDPEPVAPPPPPPEPAPSSSPHAAVPPSPPAAPLPWRDIATVGAGVVGLAGVVLGSYFGLHAISLENQAQAGCPGGRCTNAAATASDSAATSADFSTAFFATGAAGLGAAALLFFTRPAAGASALSVQPGAHGGSVSWSVRF
jgi:hypothetical protein